MAIPTNKTEEYQNLGGKNSKASPYMLQNSEVLDILNFSFIAPGAYTPRPGTTPLITGQTFAITSFTEFSRLTGASYKIFNAGYTLFSYDGTTSRAIHGIAGGPANIIPSPTASTLAILSFAPFVDRLFVGGGLGPTFAGDFFKTNGVTAYSYSLPGVYIPNLISTITMVSNSTSGWTGYYQYGFCWLNERGYIGPLFDRTIFTNPTNITTEAACIGASQTTAAIFNFTDVLSNLVPGNFGITAMVVFRSGPLSGTVGARPGPEAGITYLANLFDLSIIPLSATFFSDSGATFGAALSTGNTLASQSLWFTATPRYVDVFNNSLLMMGFSNSPSTFYFSQIGEPELVGNTAYIEVRTNDSDRLSGGRNYAGQYTIFKTKSVHSFTGDNPTNYSLQQISNDYGCIGNRAACTYESYLLFLDRHGIVRYDGANINIITSRVEPTFRRMNYAAALDQAVMLHVKDRNEVWCAFPIDGATINNYMVIYDYLANSFSEWQGPQIASLSLATDTAQFITPFTGNYSGVISYFNPNLFSDNGAAFTCMVMPRYFGGQGNELGFGVEKIYRKLYLNILDPNNNGQTSAFKFNFMADGSTAILQTQTFSIIGSGATQPRLDFGIPGKSLSFQMFYVPVTSVLQFSGFTIEYRFQRNV